MQFNFFCDVITSDIPLPELGNALSGTDPSVTIRKSTSSFVIPKGKQHKRDFCSPAGHVIASIGESPEGYLYRHFGIADFFISKSFHSVKYSLTTNIPQEVFRHILLNVVLPNIFSAKGSLVLHSGAVLLPNGTVALFLGDSGSGKSTLSTAFALSGSAVLTDDCLMLIKSRNKEIHAVASYPGIRLWRDSAEAMSLKGCWVNAGLHNAEKLRLDTQRPGLTFATDEAPVSVIYILGPWLEGGLELVNFSKVSPVNAFTSLIRRQFGLGLPNRQIMNDSFRQLTEIMPLLPPLYYLNYQQGYSKLGRIIKTIIQHASAE